MSTYQKNLIRTATFGADTFGADFSVYPAIAIANTTQTGDVGRLKIRSSPDTTNGDANVIGSVAHGMSLQVTGNAVSGFSPVDLTSVPNASRTGEPGGSATGDWPAGTTGFAYNTYLAPAPVAGTSPGTVVEIPATTVIGSPALTSAAADPGTETMGDKPADDNTLLILGGLAGVGALVAGGVYYKQHHGKKKAAHR